MSLKKRKSVAENEENEGRCNETEKVVNDFPPVKKIRYEKDIENEDETEMAKERKVAIESSEAETASKDGAENKLGEEEVSKKHRHGRKRKKKIYIDIIKQMEFYFSDANIAKSNFMQEKLKASEWLDLNVFMNFNKLAGFLNTAFERVDPSDLFSALSRIPSDLLEVRQTGELREIRRKKALITREKQEEDASTIYIENLPLSATIDSVKELFQKFGKVLYVSLPKYRITQMIKGFAFVEFDTPESAKKALKTLVVEKSRLRQDMDPGELLSVKTFINEQAMEKEAAVKKETPAQSKTEMTEQKGPVKEKKKSRGKKNKQKETAGAHEVAAMGFPPQESSLDFGGLQIISKADWKKLRNTYLNLQRKNMSQAKQKIRQFAAQHPEQFEAEKPKYEAVSEVAAPHIKAEEDVGLAFEPKVVVHFSLEEPIYDVVMLKKKIKAAVMEPVKYIDARPGANSFYVRCGSAEQAKTLSNVKILGDGKVLNDAEEKDYWQKANSDRKEKLEGKVKVKSSRPRGKDKVVKQFKKMEEKQANNHKFFEEED